MQGVKKKEPPILGFSNFIFALIASIYQNELFIMNLSIKRGTVGLYRSIGTEDTRQNWSQILTFTFL